MPVSVTIHHSVWGDDRYQDLARRAGYPGGVDQAITKMARLWSLCTEMQTDLPPIGRIRSCLGGDTAEAWLIGAELGERLDDGSIRVRGCEGRIDWYATVIERQDPTQQAKAGRARASSAKRDPRGRLVKSSSALEHETSSGIQRAGESSQRRPAELQPSEPVLPDRARCVDGRSVPELPDPGAGGRIERVQGPPPVDRAPVRARGAAVPPPPLVEAQERTVRPVPLDPAPEARTLNPEAVQRRRLVDAFVSRVNASRAKLAGDLRLTGIRPIALMGEGERQLMERLREAADPAGDMDHVLRVAEAEAKATRELRWFGWSLAESKSWRVRLASPLPSSRTPTDPRGPVGSQPSSPPPPEIRLTEEERAEFSELALRLAGKL